MKVGSVRQRGSDTRRESCAKEALACSSEMCCDASNGKLRTLPSCHTTGAHLARHRREEAEGKK